MGAVNFPLLAGRLPSFIEDTPKLNINIRNIEISEGRRFFFKKRDVYLASRELCEESHFSYNEGKKVEKRALIFEDALSSINGFRGCKIVQGSVGFA